MAEFCLDCWNMLMVANDTAEKFVISKEPDLCEGCGEWKPVIIRMKLRYLLRQILTEIKYKNGTP